MAVFSDPNRDVRAAIMAARTIGKGVGMADGGVPPETPPPQPPIVAYHGSPHSFDQFDVGKIGTGEGAQANFAGAVWQKAERFFCNAAQEKHNLVRANGRYGSHGQRLLAHDYG